MARVGNNALTVDFDIQHVGHVHSTNELLYNLAVALFDALPSPIRQEWPEPDEAHFAEHNPYTAFDRFLRQLDRVRNNYRIIVAVDEFELVEKAIKEDNLDPALVDSARTDTDISLVHHGLCGPAHTPQEIPATTGIHSLAA